MSSNDIPDIDDISSASEEEPDVKEDSQSQNDEDHETTYTQDIKCLVVGDLHFQTKNLILANDFSVKLVSIVKEKKPSMVILMGDMLHEHNTVKVEPHNAVEKLIDDLSRLTKVICLIGNHDLVNHLQCCSKKHIFNPFKKWPNVTIVDEPIFRRFGKVSFTFAPYVPKGKLRECLENYLTINSEPWEQSNCVFVHQEFKGCKMGAIESEDGDEWGDDLPVVISGHIHDPQKVGSNVYYVGAPLQTSKVWLVTFRQREESTFNEKLIEKIDLGLKMKKTIQLDVAQCEDKFNPDLIDKYELRVELTGTPEQFKVFRRSKFYGEMSKKNVKVVFSPNVAEVASLEKYELPQRERVAFQDIMQKVVDTKDGKTKEAFREVKKILGSMRSDNKEELEFEQ